MTNELIKIESIVGVKHGPQVKLSWGREAGMLSVEEARQHALSVLEAADAAESDGFVYHFMKNTAGLSDQKAAAVVADFRRFRSVNRIDNSKELTDEQMTAKNHCPACGNWDTAWDGEKMYCRICRTEWEIRK